MVLCSKRLTRFCGDRNLPLAIWKAMATTMMPRRTGRTPLSPLRMRCQPGAQVLTQGLGEELRGDLGGGGAAVAAVRSTGSAGPARRRRSAGRSLSQPWLRRSPRRRRRPAACGDARSSRPGGHVLDDALPVEAGHRSLGHHPAEVEHGDPVGHLEDVVEVVGDHHHRQAVVAEAAHQVEDHPGLDHAQGGGGLVEEDHLGVPHHRLGDRHRLALPSRERGHRLADGAHRGHPQAAQRLGRGPLHGVLVEQPAAEPLPAQEHVLDDVEVVGQGEVLVDGLDAQARRRPGWCGCAPAGPRRRSARGRSGGPRRCSG